MSVFRDILAIIGSLSLCWVFFAWNDHSEKALAQGVVMSIIALIITISCIRGDQRRIAQLRRNNDQLRLKNEMLKLAVKTRQESG